MKHCGTCGAELPDEASFCPVCEEELIDKAPLRAPRSQHRRAKRRALLALIVLALLAGGFGLWRGVVRKASQAEAPAAPVASDLAESGGSDALTLPAGGADPAGLPEAAQADAVAGAGETASVEELDPHAAAYAQAEALLSAGETYQAARAFYAIRDYSDAWERCFDAWGLITERKTVDTGTTHAIGSYPGGTVVVDGSNEFGQCDVSGWSDIAAVAVASTYTVGLRKDGTVVAAGRHITIHDYGQLDVGGWTDIVAIAAGDYYHTVGLRADGTVLATGPSRDGLCDVDGWSDIVAIAAGGYHTVGLRADGTVVAAGYNGAGQCDVGDWSDIVAIAAGGSLTLGVRADGTVLATGNNNYGQCDVGDWTDIVAIDSNGVVTAGLRADGSIVTAGGNVYFQYDTEGWRDIVAIAAGSCLLGLRADGSVAATGQYSGNYRERVCHADAWLGLSTPAQARPAPPLSAEERAALDAAYAQAEALLSAGETYKAALSFYAIRDYADAWERCFEAWGELAERKTLAVGTTHAIGLHPNGTVVADGANGLGQCEVSGWSGIVAVTAGGANSLGLRANGTIVTTAANGDVGGWNDIVAIFASQDHVVGLRGDGSLVSAGSSTYGKREIGGWTQIVTVATGYTHTVGLRADGTVVAAGDNSYGQCEVGDWTDIVAIAAGQSTTAYTVGLRADGTVVATGSNIYGQCEVDDWTDIVAIAVSNFHTLGLRADGTVLLAGLDRNGVYDLSRWHDIVAIAAGGSYLLGLRADGSVVSAGAYSLGYSGGADEWTGIKLPALPAGLER